MITNCFTVPVFPPYTIRYVPDRSIRQGLLILFGFVLTMNYWFYHHGIYHTLLPIPVHGWDRTYNHCLPPTMPVPFTCIEGLELLTTPYAYPAVFLPAIFYRTTAPRS